MRRSRAPQILRGLVAASFATFVALFSHVTAGGAPPSILGIAAPLLLSFAACALLAGRRLSLVRLTISVGVSQFLFHSLFGLGVPAALPTGHAHHTADTIATLAAPVSHAAHSGASMWVAHLIAGAITIAALYFAESILTALAEARRFVVRRFAAALTLPVVVRPAAPRPASVIASTAPTKLSVFPATLAHRGPPLLPVS